MVYGSLQKGNCQPKSDDESHESGCKMMDDDTVMYNRLAVARLSNLSRDFPLLVLHSVQCSNSHGDSEPLLYSPMYCFLERFK